MRKSNLTTAVLAILLSGGTLCAEPAQAGNKDRFDQRKEVKRSSVAERIDSRRNGTSMQVPKPSRDRTPPTRYKEPKAPKTIYDPAQANDPRKPLPAHQKVQHIKRTPAWIPPKVKPLPHYHRPGYTAAAIPKTAISITFGTMLFYYSDGIYYRPHSSGYIVILPPIGLLVPVLPLGYLSFHVYGGTYYYYADVYYVWDIHHHAYRVVEAPESGAPYQPGMIVDTLPDGAYTLTIDGVQYYRYGDVYFLQSIQGERIVYIVVTP